ncbi:MAG: hypothetical protein Q8O29_01960 [Polaromonas sp.]|uniref:hypothetical protein n=1 Tax=Polaromonas sp. TaxID=1869339 RepID=UPI002733985D|nr:hypothetical protein [Polaromonas sp.]MDP2817041.1 hypothetical protein [Polaromonas sp.]
MIIFLHLFKKRCLLAVGLGMCAAAGALAITLGPNTRSAVLGQPLDISVQMMLESGDDQQALCLEASVFYVDKQLDKSQVQVSLEKSSNAQQSLIRIRSTSLVEGPVVTVHLRAGCVQKTVRRYVVLAAAKPRSIAPGADASSQVGGTPLSGATQDNPQGIEKIQALEGELRQLRDELQNTQSALDASKEQLQLAQSGRYGKQWVYGLGGLLFLTLGGLFFLLLRRRTPVQPLQGSLPGMLPDTPATSSVDLDIDESLFDDLKRRPPPSIRPPQDSVPPLARRDRAKFSVSVPFVPRTVKVPEIFDLQQQVEFFSSLGQQDKAIALLRKHLVNNVKTSALVYLDLLDLYHQTGNREDYEVLRTDFNQVFNTQIAPFDSYTAIGPNAAAYTAVMDRIEAAWPKRHVFDIIDNTLFREPGNPAEVLDLEAYRELLLLHAVAREIIDLQAEPTDSTMDTHWPDLAMQPRSSPRLGLDIDLNQLSGGANPDKMPGSHVRAAARSTSARAPKEPTAFDSLVDFDDYDTGFRPDDLSRA